MRLKLTIGYDGSAFNGWQSQPFGTTVQDVLEDALRRITGGRVVVHGSGRTDTGVHALAQVAHVTVTERFSVEKWQMILNYNLPPTIRIMRCRRAPDRFHARFSARGKTYRYLIRNQEVVSPHEVARVWMVPGKIDITLLRAAATVLVGRHDFRGFAATRGDQPKTTVRTILRITVASRGSLISITFQGEGFLYKMVRMLTAAMLRVAQGKDTLSDLERRLQSGRAPTKNHVAPPDGLYLVKVAY